MRQIEAKGENLDLYRRYVQQRDALYELREENQDAVFHKLYVEYFSLIGYSDILHKSVQEFPLFLNELDKISFFKADKLRDEGSDLFVQSEDDANSRVVKTMVYKIMPDQFADIVRLKILFLREFLHIHDMLDPEFGYKPSLASLVLNVENKAGYNLIQDRYRVLWQAYIDVRLSDKYPDYMPVELLSHMNRVFYDFSEKENIKILEKLKTGRWTHSTLLDTAGNGCKRLDIDDVI